MEILLEPSSWIALLTLTFLEIVLGVDNIIFISIVSNKLPEHQQQRARTIGLSLALILRVGMLLAITWIIKFKDPIFELFEMGFSIRDIILFLGGLFLLYKSTIEIHHKMEGEVHAKENKRPASLTGVITQIILLDIIFSFDSILTAVGLTDQLLLMIIAVVVAIVVMMVFAKSISEFIGKHPTLEILALSFLILIGFMLLVEGLHVHVPKGYIYFAVFFSLMVEIINMRIRKSKGDPVKLHKRIEE